jgi:anti-sigma-K factor RskA
MTERDPLITRLESLGPDEWRPEPPPGLVMPPGTEPAPRRRALTLRPLPALAAVLLLLALGAGGAIIATSRDPEPGQTLALAPLKRGGAAEGEVRLTRAGGRATLAVSGLAPSRRGEFYELWLLSPPGDLVSLGSFRVGAGGRATLDLPVPVDPSRYRFLDVSVEPDDGDSSHSSRSVLRGRT